MSPLAGTVIEHGIEQDERIWPRRDLEVVLRIVEPRQQRSRRGEMSARRAACRRNPLGVDAEFVRMLANVTHGGLRILDTDDRRIWLALWNHAIFHPNPHHAAGRKVFALRFKLIRRA